MGKASNNDNTRIIFGAIGVLITILGGIQGFIINEVQNCKRNQHLLEIRVTIIESSRFTRQDGEELSTALLELERNLNKIPLENPPRWLNDLVLENKRRIDVLSKRRKAAD